MRWLAGGTLFLGSLLLFSFEPMLAKMLLPRFGGGAIVWTSSLLFFQCALLLGYLLAHAGRGRAAIVIGVLGLGLALLPPRVRAVETGVPALDVVLTLAASAGLPFVALSALAPSVQAWLGGAYSLYAASNAGSLLALVLYALVVERALGLRAQATATLVLYLVVAAAALVLAARTKRAPVKHEPAARGAIPAWIVLSAVPSAYLAAVTAHVTTEIAPTPVVWLAPLALYLLTFVIVFGGLEERALRIADLALPLGAGVLVFVMAEQIRRPAWLVSALHVLVFFLAALVCHARLARARPEPGRLTAFYVWIALGGLLGTALIALVAPRVLDRPLEYPLLLFLALALRPSAGASDRTKRSRAIDALFVVMVAGLALGAMSGSRALEGWIALAVYPGLPCALALVAVREPARFALAIAVLLGVANVYTGQGQTLWRSRNDYGSLRVSRDARFVSLTNGSTVHGRQALDPALRDEPIGYYAESGPLGDVFVAARALGETERVMVIGLGAGTTAAYERPGEAWTFYELDPDDVAVARSQFTYLRASRARVVVSDARKALEREPSGAGLLVIDAFTSDAVPTHLLTLEAARTYLEKARVLAWHVSNWHLDLPPMLGRLAARLGVPAAVRDDSLLEPREISAGKSASVWVVFGPHELLARLGKGWEPLGASEGPLWTDDRSSVLDVLARD